MKKFTSNRFLELFLACAMKNNDYVISKSVIQENLTDYYLDNHYGQLFKNIFMHIDKEEAKKGNYVYYIDLDGAFKEAVKQGQLLEMSSKKDMYMINFSENMVEQLIDLYTEDDDFGKTYTKQMQILVEHVKLR